MTSPQTNNKAFEFSVADNPAQRRFMESTAREVLYSGAFGAGKSRVGCEKGLFLSLKYPGNFGAILRKTLTSLRYTTMQTWFRYTCPASYIEGWNQLTNICKLKNGSQVVFLGLDDYQKIGSLELGWAFIDEAIELTEADYMMLLGRLRLSAVPFRQIFAATNPGPPSHFLRRRFYLEHDPNTFVVEAKTTDNKTLPPDYVASLQRFTGRYYQRYVEGKWVGFEGLVYDCFDPNVHVVTVANSFAIPSHWRRFRSIDFGYTNPCVVQWWAEHPELESPDKCQCLAPHHHRAFYLYRELYMSQRTAEQNAEQTKRLSGSERYIASFSDHAAGDRATFERLGVPTTKANKDISAGIQTVYELLASQPPQLYFFADALVERDPMLAGRSSPTSTIDEFGSYAWRESPAGKNEKEEPKDLHNHGMDAMRYFAHSLLAAGPATQEVRVQRLRSGDEGLALPRIRSVGRWDKGLTARRGWRSA